MAVYEVVGRGRAYDATLAMCACNIWLLTSVISTDLVVNHFPDLHDLTTDLLSRWQ